MYANFTDPPRFWRQLAGLSALLALLFAVLEPPSTAHLGFIDALVVWLLHVGVGMVCALAVTGGLLRCVPRLRRRPWLALLYAGLLGGLLFAPLALGLESLFPQAPATSADDWLDQWETAGGVRALVAEYVSLMPSYLAAWLLVNASPMLRIAHPDLAPPGDPPSLEGPRAVPQERGLWVPDSVRAEPLSPPAGESTDVLQAHVPDSAATGNPVKPAEEGLLQRLPVAVGRQLVSISADLHYLHVTTRRGRATVLGSLAEAEAELGARGMRIHRSHWIALDAVRRLRRTAKGWRCELIDGRSLPVSRRRATEAKERLGTDFVVEG